MAEGEAVCGRFRAGCGVSQHAVAVNFATAALSLALEAIGPQEWAVIDSEVLHRLCMGFGS